MRIHSMPPFVSLSLPFARSFSPDSPPPMLISWDLRALSLRQQCGSKAARSPLTAALLMMTRWSLNLANSCRAHSSTSSSRFPFLLPHPPPPIFFFFLFCLFYFFLIAIFYFFLSAYSFTLLDLKGTTLERDTHNHEKNTAMSASRQLRVSDN